MPNDHRLFAAAHAAVKWTPYWRFTRPRSLFLGRTRNSSVGGFAPFPGLIGMAAAKVTALRVDRGRRHEYRVPEHDLTAEANAARVSPVRI